MEIFSIPSPFQIVIDDVGWWCGKDSSNNNGPSRSGLNVRRHCPDDYKSIAKLGKSLDMRILCGFIIGEWDRSNILAHVRNSNQYGAFWDNASRLDPSIDEARDFINSSSDYMEIALHGLMHMYWDDSGRMTPAEFYVKDASSIKYTGNADSDADDTRINATGNARYIMAPPDIVREHLDAFLEIYLQNGFKGSMESYLPPCFQHVYSDKTGHLSSILAGYGIKYIIAPYSWMGYTSSGKPSGAAVENGIITCDRGRDMIKWTEVSPQAPDTLRGGYFGMHWINVLNADALKNDETTGLWIKYFSRYRDLFDIIISRDNAMASSQSLYKKYASVCLDESASPGKKLKLDFSSVDGMTVTGLLPSVYINIRRPYVLVPDGTAYVELYGESTDFITYKLTRKGAFTITELLLTDWH